MSLPSAFILVQVLEALLYLYKDKDEAVIIRPWNPGLKTSRPCVLSLLIYLAEEVTMEDTTSPWEAVNNRRLWKFLGRGVV